MEHGEGNTSAGSCRDDNDPLLLGMARVHIAACAGYGNARRIAFVCARSKGVPNGHIGVRRIIIEGSRFRGRHIARICIVRILVLRFGGWLGALVGGFAAYVFNDNAGCRPSSR